MIYAITGWQGYSAPHWHIAYVEAKSEDEAKAILLTRLRADRDEEAWGWPDNPPNPDYPDDIKPFHDPANWTIHKEKRPFIFVLGGGCR